MLRVIFLAVVFGDFCFFFTSAQSGADARYVSAVRDFVRAAVIPALDSGDRLILEDSIDGGRDNEEFLGACLEDTATFSAEERREIRAWVAHPPFRVWTADLAPDAQLIRKDTVFDIFTKRATDGWRYFHRHVGRDFYTLGCPLFLRNYNWCLFYSGCHCGWLCGEGRLGLYKKVRGKWVFVKNWGTWES